MSNSNFHTRPLPLGHCRAQRSDLYNTTATTTTTKTPFVVAQPIVDEKTEEAEEKWMCGDDEVARWKVEDVNEGEGEEDVNEGEGEEDVNEGEGEEDEDGMERRELVDEKN